MKTPRLFVCACICIFSSVMAMAQGSLSKGRAQLNAGLGFSGWGVPVYAGFDYGVHKDITVGGELSYRSYEEDWRFDRYRHRITGITGNVNYHFNSLLKLPSPWDVYGGAGLGLFIWSSPGGYGGSHTNGLGLGLQVGGRYFFSPKVGLNLEFGGLNVLSGGKVGITVKL